jgi:hypothetical protein
MVIKGNRMRDLTLKLWTGTRERAVVRTVMNLYITEIL